MFNFQPSGLVFFYGSSFCVNCRRQESGGSKYVYMHHARFILSLLHVLPDDTKVSYSSILIHIAEWHQFEEVNGLPFDRTVY